jgi:hypothetical protein
MAMIRTCPRCGAGWPEARTRCECGTNLLNEAEDGVSLRRQWLRDRWQALAQPRERRLLLAASGIGLVFHSVPWVTWGGSWEMALVLGPLPCCAVVILRWDHLRSMALAVACHVVLFALFAERWVFLPFVWLAIALAGAVTAMHAEHRRALGP